MIGLVWFFSYCGRNLSWYIKNFFSMTKKSSFLEFLYSSTGSTISKYMILDNDRVQTGKYLNGYSVLVFSTEIGHA